MHPILQVILAIVVLICGRISYADHTTHWTPGDGLWSDASKWRNKQPTDLDSAEVGGKSVVTVPQGRHVVGMMRLGTRGGDHVRLRVQGELIVRRDFVQIGEFKGGVAEVYLDGGAFHAVSAVYLGGANHGKDRGCSAILAINGGSFLARILTLGWGSGSTAEFQVNGSKPNSVHLLDGLVLGSDHDEAPSKTMLAFTLDRNGVTPITIASRMQGLTIVSGRADNQAQLSIAVSEVPPRDDILLIAQHTPTRGTFHGLPEGATVKAALRGRTYRWKLTYKGGRSGCDVVLTRGEGHADDAQTMACRDRPEPPEPLWLQVNNRLPLPSSWEPAFVGAEGSGAMARGGRGGREVRVTNLKDSGAGSLRDAVETDGARLVTFAVGGSIELLTPLVVRKPFITIDGSNAPVPGITLRNRGMTVTTHDVILRYFRIRPGVPSEEWEGDALEFSDAQRCIADHLSLSWATDESLSVVGLSDCITIQWCILAEPLNDRKHAYGSIIGGERTTWHHNLFAHMTSRVPRFASIANVDFRNNVLYDWGHTAGYGQFERLNYVANYLKPGPSTRQNPPWYHSGDCVVQKGSLYLLGNVLAGHRAISEDNQLGVGYEPSVLSMKPFEFLPVVTDEAPAAFDRVLSHAGAELPARDRTDDRVVRQTHDGTGEIIERVARDQLD